MKIYVAEQYHDNDSGIYATVEAALADVKPHVALIQEYELRGNRFFMTENFWSPAGTPARHDENWMALLRRAGRA